MCLSEICFAGNLSILAEMLSFLPADELTLVGREHTSLDIPITQKALNTAVKVPHNPNIRKLISTMYPFDFKEASVCAIESGCIDNVDAVYVKSVTLSSVEAIYIGRLFDVLGCYNLINKFDVDIGSLVYGAIEFDNFQTFHWLIDYSFGKNTELDEACITQSFVNGYRNMSNPSQYLKIINLVYPLYAYECIIQLATHADTIYGNRLNQSLEAAIGALDGFNRDGFIKYLMAHGHVQLLQEFSVDNWMPYLNYLIDQPVAYNYGCALDYINAIYVYHTEDVINWQQLMLEACNKIDAFLIFGQFVIRQEIKVDWQQLALKSCANDEVFQIFAQVVLQYDIDVDWRALWQCGINNRSSVVLRTIYTLYYSTMRWYERWQVDWQQLAVWAIRNKRTDTLRLIIQYRMLDINLQPLLDLTIELARPNAQEVIELAM